MKLLSLLRKCKFTFCAILGLSCSSPDFVTNKGSEIYLMNNQVMTKDQADVMESYLSEEVTKLPRFQFYQKEVNNCFKGVIVQFDKNKNHCGYPCAGEQHNEILHVLANDCPYKTAYIHEMTHWLQQCLYNGYDPDHTDPELWPIVYKFNKECK